MRRPLLVLGILAPAVLVSVVAACEQVSPPPGEPIGTFALAATLDTGPGPAGTTRCLFAGSPGEIAFEATLTYLPDRPAEALDGSTNLYLQVEDVLREGSLVGTSFATRSPSARPGVPEPFAPRHLRACGDCTLRFVERIGGELAREIPAGGCEAALLAADGGCADGGCVEPPVFLDGGGLDPSAVGAICGFIREEVTPGTAGCRCTVAGEDLPFETPCEIYYSLEGRRR